LTHPSNAPTIGRLNEKPLHSALKGWLAQPGDRFEVEVDGFRIDIVRGDLLIEIQTASFSALRRKLALLVPRHQVQLVYPIAREKWLLKRSPDRSAPPTRRKSPKRGRVEDLFHELVSFPEMVRQANFSLEVLLIQEEEVRRHDARRAWRRRGWVTEQRHLLRVMERHHFQDPQDFGELLPQGLPDTFTTADLAEALGRPRRLAQRMAYCLRKMQVVDPVGKKGRAVLYRRCVG
jgi:hypothetical protein